jgi:hypothetical protein
VLQHRHEADLEFDPTFDGEFARSDDRTENRGDRDWGSRESRTCESRFSESEQ